MSSAMVCLSHEQNWHVSVAQVFITSRANHFLLFIGKERTNRTVRPEKVKFETKEVLLLRN